MRRADTLTSVEEILRGHPISTALDQAPDPQGFAGTFRCGHSFDRFREGTRAVGTLQSSVA